jgi:DNA-binding CsgD family transcriptional regulator
MPYQMVVYAMPSTPARAALNKDEALAVAIMYDPAGVATLRVDVLHVYYDLTHAEGRLASELYSGKSLPDASKVLGISINTARTQLRSIFRKVGVNSQAALLQQFAQSMKENPSEPGPAADVIDIRSRKS